MRIWVNPDKLAKYGVTAGDVSVRHSSTKTGKIRQALWASHPRRTGTAFQYTMVAPGRLVDPSQFEDIIIRGQPNGALLRVRDVARVELGAQNYTGFSRAERRAAVQPNLILLYLAHRRNSNATETSDRVKAFVAQAKKNFPSGIDYVIPYDSTMFVRAAIKDVLITLLEAIGLVIMVVFVFLQSWRATLIPLLTVPVAAVGTFALFPILGFSINITNMFGLVLAIGIVVDDAIVVVESVQRHIDEGKSPRDATIQAMDEVSAPVVAIAFILAFWCCSRWRFWAESAARFTSSSR